MQFCFYLINLFLYVTFTTLFLVVLLCFILHSSCAYDISHTSTAAAAVKRTPLFRQTDAHFLLLSPSCGCVSCSLLSLTVRVHEEMRIRFDNSVRCDDNVLRSTVTLSGGKQLLRETAEHFQPSTRSECTEIFEEAGFLLALTILS